MAHGRCAVGFWDQHAPGAGRYTPQMLKLLGRVFLKLIGGSRNDRIVRGKMRTVEEQMNPLEERLRPLSDAELLGVSEALRERRRGGESRQGLLSEAFSLVREASRRARSHRQFDVQLVAGQVLDDGWIAEEATGEGKTIACYPAVYMAWLEGMHTHVVTVNDTLVRRDAEFARPVFELLGMTVGYITADMPAYGPDAAVRRQAYACDVTYGTNSEFGFDYLRDNMKMSVAEQVQRSLDFAIVDEVDSILIDEARTPLIISGQAHGDTAMYRKADAVAREVLARNRAWDRANQRVESLKRQIKSLEGEAARARGERGDSEKKLRDTEARLAEAEEALEDETKLYEIELDNKAVHLTHEGVGGAQEIAGVGSFYVGANMEWPHLMEQALRAHLVYEKDKDYIVRDGRVVIVDEFTGRLLEGREWSDGLHQAVEAKERVTVKEETQTLATITLQNYFKLYRKLAGMTGTAMTEATEFLKVYELDAAAVPTHRPVNRVDHEDRIYADVDAKYDAIVEEIRYYSRDLGRPVLVGTTSIEKSEKIAEMLKRRHGVEHQLLNGRPENAARENEIVALAGLRRPLKKGGKPTVGTVTIATNMAGRGTDIKLGEGVVCPGCKVPPAEKLAALGVALEDLFPPGATKCCIHCPQYDPATNCAHCFKPKLSEEFPLRGRTDCRKEVPCGLHIVGTERHEARRIDNQLRGRSGRQGDPGSSRFFLSLRDDLLSIFAGPWTLKVLGWLGLQGDMAIEDRRVSGGISRAQRKVEERNFETRKNLLEYDEVMDHQRRTFYSQRQMILEGRDLEGLVRDMVRESVADAVANYLDGRYPQRCIAEWARQTLQAPIRDEQITAETPEELPALEEALRERGKEEAANVVTMTLGEYMDEDVDRKEWDLKGLSSWAMSRFNVNLSQNQLRRMDAAEVERALTEAAAERIDQMDLSPVGRFLEPGFAPASLAEWARGKFGVAVTGEDLTAEATDVEAKLLEAVEDVYRRREIEYPVEYVMDVTVGQGGTENVYALGSLVEWANRKYEAGLQVEDLRGEKPDRIRARLTELSEAWLYGGQLERAIREGLGAAPSVDRAIEFAGRRFDTDLSPADFDSDIPGKVRDVGRQFLRREMTELERFVLLQIYDNSWMDHLLGMDHLKSGIGLRSYAEQDPRVAYKREGSRLFQEMLSGVRNKVTDMIFKVRLTADTSLESGYQVSSVVHEQLTGYDHLAREMSEQQQAGEVQKVQTIVRDLPRVGRNDPCPCGSGKKFKRCCGRNL